MDKTELVFILDESGSMSGLEKDTIGGFNSLIEKQKKEKGEAVVTTVIFSDNMKFLHDRVEIKDVETMTDKDYTPSGCTALLDTIGNTINHIIKKQSELKTKCAFGAESVKSNNTWTATYYPTASKIS